MDGEAALTDAVLKMTEIEYYDKLRKNISKLDFGKIEDEQVEGYL